MPEHPTNPKILRCADLMSRGPPKQLQGLSVLWILRIVEEPMPNKS